MEINHKYSLEGQMLKLELQYFGHLMRRTDSGEKTLCQEDPLEKGMAAQSSILAWRIPWTAWWATVHGITKSQIQLSD